MSKKLDIQPGNRFGRLVIVSESETIGRRRFLCRCDCGKETVVQLPNLTTGSTQSCGCYKSDRGREANITHGAFGTRLYGIWAGMLNRCRNSNVKAYRLYGARGIQVCEKWYHFEAFHEWAIANGYATNLTIDRIDNDGNYEPSNCRWITWKAQHYNRRNNHLLTVKGETLPLQEWANKYGIGFSTILRRLQLGWSEEQSVVIPVGGQR